MTALKPKVLVVFGTRPEAIKMALLAKTLKADPAVDCRVCVTAQHRSMLDQVLSIFELTPDDDLDVMRPGQTLPALTARVLEGMTERIQAYRPDWVVVQGDTTTAFVAGLAAFYEKVAVAHVEAGLRTGFKYSPFPEEMNRKLVGALTDLHLAPTPRARDALLREGIPEAKVHVTGNTVVDALLHVSKRIDDDGALRATLDARFAMLDRSRRLVLVTGHRRENFGEPFQNMCEALVDLVRAHPDVEILYPVHLNPNVQAPVNAILGGASAELRARIHLIEPVEYVPFVYLMKRSTLIVTDSGGVQEEAPSLGKPVLVTRNDTERPEAVDAGTAKLVGTNRARIVAEASRLLSDAAAYDAMSRAHNPYGDGKSIERIARLLATVKPERPPEAK